MEKTFKKARISSASLRWIILVSVISLLVGWGLNTPAGLLGKADAIGYAVCHRIDLRSFHLGDRVLPLCARCSGMYLGALIGLLYQSFIGRRRAGFPSWPILVVLVLFVGSFVIDGGNSYLALFLERGLLYAPTNTLRLFTGTGMGLVIASALYPAFNQTAWRDSLALPVYQSIFSFAGMILLAIFVDILVLLEQPALLYLFALLSAGSVLLVLTMLYSMVFIMVTRQENKFIHLKDLALSLWVGFGIGMLQIGLLDLLRFWITGTWDGFHFG